MSNDASVADLVGREFPPTDPYLVSEDRVAEFAAATGTPYAGSVPATFPIVLAMDAMQRFLAVAGIDLFRIVHGDQRFEYARPVRIGDRLTAALEVVSVRSIGGNDIIGTRSAITDADGVEVCATSATLVHRGGAA
ncbi:FAS1-like dehydratase domain-containing protein [Nocardioides limicola]|uniref:FAS1-like dehydratase domain-containing protein n=1 Tax=Nocardioides limicola TaxID=2803368 RepID=UPI0027DAFFAC|nr:MaoC family dehydratase N-terminal domain-containing protein [Nocardioides sp. DJM-14]